MVYEQHFCLLDNKDRDGEIDLVVNMRHGMFPLGASNHARHSPAASGMGCDARQEHRTIARQQPHRLEPTAVHRREIDNTASTLISSDSHIIEPADLWEQRIDHRFKDRAPCLVHEGEVDQWYADGVKFGNIGTNQQAGLRFEAPEKLTAAGSMATIPQGGV